MIGYIVKYQVFINEEITILTIDEGAFDYVDSQAFMLFTGLLRQQVVYQ